MGKASSGKRAAKTGGTRDHTVPQMYLKHFALPGPDTRGTDRCKHVDHLMQAEGAIGFALVEVAYDVADQFVIHHPEHDPWKHWKPSSPGQPKPWDGQKHSVPQ